MIALAAAILALAAPMPASAALSAAATPTVSFNTGAVWATAQFGNRLYVGGLFSLAGRTTGPAAAIDPNSGEYDAAMPKVSGSGARVLAIAPDGHGGWYVGGQFTHVGGVPRSNLAHILPDKTVDPNWAPDSDGVVAAIAVGPDGTVYVGGGFSAIGSNRAPNTTNRFAIAALDPRTGDTTDWNPHLQPAPVHDPTGVMVLRIGPDGKLYVGGGFAGIGGQPRQNLAALDPITAQATTFNPGANGLVRALAFSPDGTTVYAGGRFTTIGGQSRNGVAALDRITSAASGWNPNPTGATTGCTDQGALALAVAPSGTIYAGGCFTTIGGQARTAIAALDPTTGNANSWNANLSGSASNVLSSHSEVDAIAIAASGNIYVAGNFTQIGGQTRYFIAALDATTAAATSWNPSALDPVFRIAVGPNGTVYAGGWLVALDAQPRANIAAIDTTTGTVTSWAPNASDYLTAVAVGSDGTVYAGGNFKSIGGAQRLGLAALDPTTAAATPWNPNPNFTPVFGIAPTADGKTVYVGGDFTEIAGVMRNGLAAFDSSGNLTSWDPKAQNTDAGLPAFTPITISPDGGTLYVGGSFTSIGAQVPQPMRHHIAALDPTTGNATSWNPGANDFVDAIAVAPGPGGPVYAGGAFTTIGANNQSRNNLAALDAATGNATSWNPNPTGPAMPGGIVSGVAVGADSRVYVAGQFTAIGSSATRRVAFAELDPTSGSPTAWDLKMDVSNVPDGIGAAVGPDGTLYLAGGFDGTDLSPQMGFASFGQAPEAPANTGAPQVSGTSQVGQTLGCSSGSWGGQVVYYAYQWLRDGSPIFDAARTFYTVTSADAGHALSCRVTANNYGGSPSATSDPVSIPPASPGGGGDPGGGGGQGSSGGQGSPSTQTPSPLDPGGLAGALPSGAMDTSAVGLPSQRIRVDARGGATVSLACRGRWICQGVARLLVYGARLSGHSPRGRAAMLASARFSIPPGRSLRLRMRLNSRGRRLLRVHHGRLSVELQIAADESWRRVLTSRTVALRAR